MLLAPVQPGGCLLEASSPPLLRVEDLSKLYSGHRGLRSATFGVAAGELVAVVGHNGAGKSTLMKLLAGWLIRDRGNVFIGETALTNRLSLAPLIGFVPEIPNLFDLFSVEYNLKLFARLFRLPPERVEETLAEFQLLPFRHTRVRDLSKGLRQRVSIGRALLAHPELLLLDEPTSGLDLDMTQEMHLLIRCFHSMGKTVLFTSHRPDEVRSLATRILMLRDGGVVFDGKPDAYFRSSWQDNCPP